MTRTEFLLCAALSNFEVITLKCPNGNILSYAMENGKVITYHDTSTNEVVRK